MKIQILLFIMALALPSCAQIKLKDIVNAVTGEGELTDAEVGSGLKEALEIGITKGSEQLASVDGYYKSPYKILLPEEAQEIAKKLRVVPGFSDFEANLEEKMNRAAESAAKKAAPIFVGAIKQMTFEDALNILMGEQNAATQYLHKTTYDPLYNEFNPVIVSSLNEVNAIEYWETAITAYNKLPFVKKMNPDLDDYVTDKALVGLFGMVEKEEKEIRTNVGARTSDLLKKVFAKQG